MSDSNTRAIAQLEKARQWLETHPLPHDAVLHVDTNPYRVDIWVFATDVDVMRDSRRAIGPMSKVQSDKGFFLSAELDGISFMLMPPDGTCKQVKAGTKVMQVVREIRPAETVTFSEEVDVFEWECGGVLVADDDAAVSA